MPNAFSVDALFLLTIPGLELSLQPWANQLANAFGVNE
jgi:hypothetical protein